MSRHYVTVTVNGEPRRAEVHARRLLVHFLRDDLGVTSTHVGCDTTPVSPPTPSSPAFY